MSSEIKSVKTTTITLLQTLRFKDIFVAVQNLHSICRHKKNKQLILSEPSAYLNRTHFVYARKRSEESLNAVKILESFGVYGKKIYFSPLGTYIMCLYV